MDAAVVKSLWDYILTATTASIGLINPHRNYRCEQLCLGVLFS